ncbi:Ankyrin repeat protein [Oopsacas minuta]|uniref:Ankyrin repeat protein n=1 Tax=Oopsacas minuta TaxID=111878 RepID=A0AAV7KCQ2_9METZ|nr:Ankyrin repeat protein [Oopsacas minuta]
MAQKSTPTQGGLREQILKEGKLCISKNDKLYIGIPSTTFNKPEHVVEYNNIKGRILESFVSFTKPLKMPDEGIFVDILKPFSNPSAMNTSVDYFDCIKDFISIEILFMFVLKHKFWEDYSEFMNLCYQNRHKIQWGTEDKEGNTMLHYVSIMSQYPEHACDIIQYIKSITGYNYLINKTNKDGIIPLASSLHDKFICDNAKKVHHVGIINELVQAGANLLLKTQNSNDYVWKGGDDSIFCVLNVDPSILVATKSFATNEGKKSRICCNLKEPPECGIHCVTTLNTIDLFPNYLGQVINFPCTQIAKTLFTKRHCKFDTKMPDGTMVLHHIIQFGSEELVNYMFEQKLNLLPLVKNTNTILHLAILTKNEKRAILILKLLSNPILIQMLDYQNKYNQTPLDLILVANLPNLIDVLNTRIPSFISRTDGNRNFLLHRAVIGKCTDVLKYLAEQKEIGDIVNEKNSNGDTAIMLCIQNKFVDGFPIILNITQCIADETDYRGYTLLHLAIIHFEETIFSLLLQDLVNTNRSDVINRVIRPTQSTSDKFAALLLTPLLICMYHEHFSAARLLIQQGATIDTPDCEGNSFNQYLIKHCRNPAELEEFFKVKLRKCNFKYKSPSNIPDIQDDISLLSLSIQCNNEGAFVLLLSNCSITMIAYQDRSPNNVLHILLSDKKYSHFLNPLLDRLAQLKTDKIRSSEVYQVVNKSNCENRTPLILSIHLQDSVIVNKLLELGCDAHKNIETLHFAAKYGDIKMITYILDRIQNSEILNTMFSHHNQEDETPLHIAIHREDLSMVEILYHYVDLTKQDKKGITLLNYAIEHGEKIFQVIFEKFKTCNVKLLNVSIANELPEHCVIHSISYRNLLALKTLINYSKDAINISSVHLPILHYAICKQFDEGVKFLLSLGLPLAIKKTERNFTLHKDRLQKQNISLEFTESKVCYRLSNGYVMTDIPGFTKTEYCGMINLPNVVNKNALLENLVLCGSIEPIESYLCTNTPPLSVNDKAQLSLISSQFATQEIMLYLLDENCPSFSFDWSAKNSSGNTVVHVGVFNTCIGTFLSMLEGLRVYQSKQWSYLSSDIRNIRNMKDKTALELAIFANNSEAFDALIKHGASLVTKDGYQNNILHNFCTCKNAEISYFDRILVEITKLKKDLINEYNNIGYTPLHTAVSTCNIQAYRKSIALPSCRYDAVTKYESNNIVHLAIINGSPGLLKQIIEDLKNRENMKDVENKLINKTNKKSLSPQFLAVECGNIDLILEMPEFSGVDAAGASLLHSAVKYSNKSNEHLKMINVILSKRKEMLNTKDNSNETPLHYAVKLKMEKALHLLLACNSIDLSCQNDADMTALHLAIQSTTNILRAILTKIDTPQSAHLINTQDYTLKTALHHCIEQTKNSEDELSLLLSKNPDLSVVDKYSNNVLHYAAMKKSRIKYLQTLLRHINENRPDLLQVLLSKLNQQINTPLYCAIQNSNVNGVDELLKVNASLPVVDKEGTITLCNRKPFPHIDVPIRIYEVRITNKPELCICVGFKLSVQQWILSDLPNLSITYLTHKNPSYSSHEVVEIQTITETVLTSYLLPCQCCEPLEIFINEVKNQIFNKNAKLMHLAAAHGSIQIVKFLMEYFGANIPFLDEDQAGYSIIHYSIENKDSEILRLLCDRMKNNFPEEFTKLSSKLLHFCITKGSRIESFTILLEEQYEANLSYTDEHDDTLLHLIVLHQQQDSYTKELLNCSWLSTRYCNLLNKNRNTALHLAIKKNQLNNITEILKCNPDISIQDSDGNMPLHLAVQYSTNVIIRKIIVFIDVLPNKLQLFNAPNVTDSKSMPIHLATSQGLWEVVELLLKHGAELYSIDSSGKTILHLAVQLDGPNRLDMITKILNYEQNTGNDTQFIFVRDKEGRTPLHLAIENGIIDFVRELLKHPIDLQIVDDKGETVLHYAIRKCTNELFDIIFDSILPLATQPCQERNNHPLCSQNIHGLTPLHLSIELQYEYAIGKLISQSTCVDIRDNNGMTILHYAAYFQKEQSIVIEQIIEFTKNISITCLTDNTTTEYILNSTDKFGRTPLLLAIESTNLFAVNSILACGPDIFMKDHKGNGVISYAALNPDSLEILEIILSRFKRDISNEKYVTLINELNSSGLSALHVSIYSKNLQGAKLLVENGAKLVLTQTSSLIQTIGKESMSANNVSLEIGTLSRPEKEVNIICYQFLSGEIIYSTLPSLVDVGFAEEIDFESKLCETQLIQEILQSNCTEIIEAIHEKDPNYINEEFNNIPFLHLAAQYATLPIMQYICQKKDSFKFERVDSSERQETAIHYSVDNTCPDVVDCLLNEVEQYEKKNSLAVKIIDTGDSSDCSPLQKSTKEKQWKNFMILIEHGADFTKKDSNGTILHAMISKDDSQSSEPLDCLIKAINKSNLTSEKKQSFFNITHSGLTAVHLAVSLCNTTAVKQLINAEVDLSNSNNSNNGFTIVHTCVDNPHTQANLYLLSVLCKAVAKQDLPMLRMYKIMHKKDQRGNTSLHHTLKMEKSVEGLEILLNNGAPFNVGDTHGNTPLHLGAKHNLLLHVKSILFSIQNDARERGYGPSSRKERCIAEIMKKNNKKQLPMLLTKDKDILLCMLKYWDNDTLLDLDLYRRGNLIHFAVYNQEIELIEAILASQSSTKRYDMLRSRDSDNYSPLHIAAEKNNSVIGKLLIDHGVDVNIRSVRGTPIEVAIKCEAVEFATKLINEGADIKRYVFLLANDLISEKNISRILDDRHLSIDDRYSTAYCSVIHYAARQSNTKRIAFLLRKNADLLSKDRDGRGAIHHVISCRRDPKILRAILDEAYRLDLNDPNSPNLDSLLDCDYSALTPGMHAAQLDYLEFFEVICTGKYKFHLETFHYTDPQGDNLLHHLIKCNSMRCIRFLLPYLASNLPEGFSHIVNGRNVLGLSPMGLARKKDQYETVNLLIKLCDAEFFEACPDVVHKIANEEDNKTLSSILDKMVICDVEKACLSTKIMDANDEGGYPNFAIFNYNLAPLWHKMYNSQNNRIKYHPLLKFTVDAKIKLYQWWYLLMLFLYLLFYIPMVTALLIASTHTDDMLFYYYSHLDHLRLMLEIYIILITMLYMANEAIEVFGKWKYLQNLPSSSRNLIYKPPDQIRYYGLGNLEGMVFHSVLKVFIEIPHIIRYKIHVFDRKNTDYFLRAVCTHISTSYSILELASVILLLSMFYCRLLLFFTTSPSISALHWTISALTFIAFTFKFFKFTKIFPTLGIYIETIFQVLKKDVPRFMIIILLVLVGYAGGAHLVARKFGSTSEDCGSLNECSPSSWLSDDFDSVYSLITPLLSGLLFLVGGGPANFELELYQIDIIFSIFYLTFALGIIVVLLNIFIAQLSQTYSDIHSEKHILDYKADLALHYEKQSNLAFIFEWFFSKALRRIMVETVTIPISEWKSYLKFYSYRIDSDDEILFQDLAKSTYKTETKESSNENNKIIDLKESMDAQFTKLQQMITQIQFAQQPGEQKDTTHTAASSIKSNSLNNQS